jgi:hypothetical protein
VFKGPIQVLAADPASGEAGLKLCQFFRYAHADGQRQLRLWLPPQLELEVGSPWEVLQQQGLVQAQPHPAPALLLLSDAADWQAARRLYGPVLPAPVLQLFRGSDLRSWGHGATRQPAIRVAIGRAVAEALERQGLLREAMHTVPLGWDADDLPVQGAAPREQDVLILAGDHPALGLAVQAKLQEQGQVCRLELTPWPLQQWLAALARAAAVVVIDPELPVPGLGLRRFAAMALRTPLVCTAAPFTDELCRDGHNALVRPAEAAALVRAVQELVGPGGLALRARLVDGGLAALVRHRRARERLEFEQLLDRTPSLWQQACSCHPGEAKAVAAR